MNQPPREKLHCSSSYCQPFGFSLLNPQLLQNRQLGWVALASCRLSKGQNTHLPWDIRSSNELKIYNKKPHFFTPSVTGDQLGKKKKLKNQIKQCLWVLLLTLWKWGGKCVKTQSSTQKLRGSFYIRSLWALVVLSQNRASTVAHSISSQYKYTSLYWAWKQLVKLAGPEDTLWTQKLPPV